MPTDMFARAQHVCGGATIAQPVSIAIATRLRAKVVVALMLAEWATAASALRNAEVLLIEETLRGTILSVRHIGNKFAAASRASAHRRSKLRGICVHYPGRMTANAKQPRPARNVERAQPLWRTHQLTRPAGNGVLAEAFG